MIRVVVEPHADDAFLSMHNHMCTWIKNKEPVIIMTVFSGTRKRSRDAETYAELIGAKSVLLGHDEENDIDYIQLPNYLPQTLDDAEYAFYLPLGIQHPQHKDVRKKCLVKNSGTVYYYAEIPYYDKKKNTEEFLELVSDKTLVDMRPYRSDKVRDEYWKCFKDQSRFFYFNQPISWGNLAELVFK